MMTEKESLAGKAKHNITQLFVLLGDASTTERSHPIGQELSTEAKDTATPHSPTDTYPPKKTGLAKANPTVK